MQKDKKQIIKELRLNSIINMYAKNPGKAKKEVERSTTLNNSGSDQD